MRATRWRPVRALLMACGLLGAAAVAADRTAGIGRLLDLLEGARIAYLEAYEDRGGELESPTDLEEAKLLVAEARLLDARLGVLPPDALAGIATALEEPAGNLAVPDRLAAAAAAITAKTGIVAETLPPQPPSAAAGRALYHDNCAGCHGRRGGGDGPDARDGAITPADFTNVVFMRRETPADFYTMIGLGHRRRGMPEWAQSLSRQQRWDLVAFVWGLQHAEGDRAAGARLWVERCAGCHGETGGGMPGTAADLTRPGSLIETSDRALFVRLSRPPHADALAGLSDAQRWQVVGHARGLSLGGAAPIAWRAPAAPGGSGRPESRRP